MVNTLEKIERYLIYAIALLVPIAVLATFPNPYTTIKIIILTVGVALLLLVKVARMIIGGSLELSISKYDLAVLLIAIAYILSAILRTPNKMEAVFLPGTATIIVAAALFFFLANELREKHKDVLAMFTYVAGIVISLASITAVIGLIERIPVFPQFVRTITFTPVGGNLPAAVFLAVIIPLGLGYVLTEKDTMKKAFWTVSLALITLGLLANIYNMLPGKTTSPKFAPFSVSWGIAVDTLKASPILGAGPSNYLTAFNIYRPLSYNQSDLWAIKFTQARDVYLTTLTETGFLGIGAFILLILAVYRIAKSEIKENRLVGWGIGSNMKLVSLILILVAFAFFAATPSLILLLFILLVLNSKTNNVKVNLSTTQEGDSTKAQAATRIPAILVAIPVLALVIAFAYFGTRMVSAEYSFGKSLTALAANDGGGSYDLMVKAINTNPGVDRYHASFSQLNFALANSVAQQAQAAQGEEGGQEPAQITEEQRNTIAQLVQQSIEEAKATVALNLPRSGNWKLLADTYRAIIPFAEGADQFAIDSYNQAIALDPVNPNLRLDLGGVFYSLGNYEAAIEAFRLAVIAKPDLANAHYNLAVAYRENGDYALAAEQMAITLSLIDRNSQDFEVARQALEEIEAKVPAADSPQAPGTGTPGEGGLVPPPTPAPPAVEPPLDLPEDAAPPEPPEEAQNPEPEATPEGEGTEPTPIP
jgi:tetratricopeptide (TPR) repeat protein